MTLHIAADDLASSSERALTPIPRVVLDTNALFDWLLFCDPGMAALSAAIVNGRVRWVATVSRRDEFVHVLARGRLAAAPPAERVRLETAWDRHCTECAPAPSAASRLRCTDPDDQKFLDLAIATGARWLVSRDRALLKLGRRALDQGLIIAPPARWRMP
jgi:predicted nucleic acid-binding protein